MPSEFGYEGIKIVLFIINVKNGWLLHDLLENRLIFLMTDFALKLQKKGHCITRRRVEEK